jgi:N-carbamoyl-L-amino-acid hydrolase
MPASDSITIDAPRFWSTVMRSGEIGPGKAGGLRRLALTDADKEMRDLFITWCTEAGARWTSTGSATSSRGGPGPTITCRRC